MVGTKDLAAVVDRVLERGGSVRLVGRRPAADRGRREWCLPRPGRAGLCAGDDRPPHRTPPFSDAEEAAATLGIRSGDRAALEHYLSQGRVHVGEPAPPSTRRSTPGEPTSPPAGRACSWPRAATRSASSTNRPAQTGSQLRRRALIGRPCSPTAPEPALGTSSSRGTTTAPSRPRRVVGEERGPVDRPGRRPQRRPPRCARGSSRSQARRGAQVAGRLRRATRAARVRQHHPRRPGRHRRHDAHRGRRHRESTRSVRRALRGRTRTTSTCRMTSRSLMDSPSTCPPTTARARSSPDPRAGRPGGIRRKGQAAEPARELARARHPAVRGRPAAARPTRHR